MKHLKLPEHKKKFLEACGFQQTYFSTPRESVGAMVNMELWEKWEHLVCYKLYIHFDSSETSYCNLYAGEFDPEAEYFSERNLISELKKRGFKEEERNGS